MKIYRTLLVWALRAVAVVIMAFATVNFMQMRQTVANEPDLVEAAGLSEPALTYFAPAGLIALACLALSETLALLLRQRATRA